MRTTDRPTGIIRTLPTLDKDGGHRRYVEALRHIEEGGDGVIYIALPAKPRLEVLHMYLLVGGRIEVRLNIAGYEPGDARECWDGEVRQPKFWAVCTGPVSRPEARMITCRGFQGFRYTEELW